MELPQGTVFAKYEPCNFGELEVKWESLMADPGSTGIGDFVTSGLGCEIKNSGSDDFFEKCKAGEEGAEIEIEYGNAGRDGMFEPEQLFAVFSKEDVKKLIAHLQELV